MIISPSLIPKVTINPTVAGRRSQTNFQLHSFLFIHIHFSTTSAWTLCTAHKLWPTFHTFSKVPDTTRLRHITQPSFPPNVPQSKFLPTLSFQGHTRLHHMTMEFIQRQLPRIRIIRMRGIKTFLVCKE